MANRQKANNMAARGATAKEIRQTTGVTAQAARNIVSRAATPAPSAPAPSPVAAAKQATSAAAAPKTSVQQISQQNTMAQNLRAAGGGNGVLSEKELLKITSASKGKNSEKILEKAVGKGLMIGSKVVNQYQKGKYTDPGIASARMALPAFAMAAGKDSQILQQLRDAGRQDKGSALFIGSKGSTATTLPRRIGAGNNQQPTPNTDPLPTDPGNIDLGTSEPVDDLPPMLPEELPEEQLPPGPGMMAGGGLGALGANKLNRAKSRLRQLGIYGRGTSLLGRGLQYGNALNK